jgi:WD40 repeat protein
VVWDVTRNHAHWREIIDLNFVQSAFSSRYLCLGGARLEGKGSQNHAELCLYDASGARIVRRFDAPLFHINDISFCPAQPNLLALTDNSGLSVLDVDSGQSLCFFPFTSGHGALGTLTFSPDGSLLAAAESTSSGGPSSDVLLFDLRLSKSGKPELHHVRTLSGHTAWVTALAFSPDGKMLATGGFDRKLRLWRIR